MVAVARITGSGQVTIPAELRRKHGMKPGDRVIWSEDEKGRLVMQPVAYTVADLDGIFPLLPGVKADDDFGNIIRESQAEWAETKMKRYGLT
jgi:AbrB family looped-hinge helix DNA binding protein